MGGKDETGFVPLHYVCKNDTAKQSLDIVELLVQASSNTLEGFDTMWQLGTAFRMLRADFTHRSGWEFYF